MSMNTAPTAPSAVERPVCQDHSSRVAVGTCERCGRFVCESCVDDQRICPQCVQRQLEGLPSSAPRAQWATRFLTAHVVFDSLSALSGVWVLSSEPSALRDVFEGLVALGVFGVFVASAISYLRWLHLAVRQAVALGIDMQQVTPGWAVGYWFVPFSNLVKPYHTIRNLLGGLGGQGLVDSARVNLWWGLWIAGNVLSQIQTRMTMREGLDAPSSSESYVVGILASAAGVMGALLCIGIIRAAQRELDARRP